MSENLLTAVNLMVIGMITVAAILLLVVLTANILIKLVNRFGPAPKTNQVKSTKVDSKKLAVLTAVVEHLTNGKGVIKEIKKVT